MTDLAFLEFGELLVICKKKGIEVESGDTRQTLIKKLTTKPEK